jgi:type II secretory pathway pseudopilin PulG
MGMHNQKGFSLLEVLLIIAAVAILTGIVILALNPGQKKEETKTLHIEADI